MVHTSTPSTATTCVALNIEVGTSGGSLESTGGRKDMVLGINYEGGKGIERAAACKHCLGAYNCQIAMDAPFEAGEGAPEEKRAAGRSEIQMGATDSQLITQLLPVLRHALAAAASIDEIESAVAAAVDPVTNGQMTKAAANHAGKLPPHADVIVQIARGRSAQPTWDNVVRPALEQCCADMSKCKMVNGYRATDFPHFEGAAPFVYINVGMFGRMSPGVPVGRIYSCLRTHVIDDASSPAAPMLAEGSTATLNHAGKDAALDLLPQCTLISIPDGFPFVTPEKYSRDVLIAFCVPGATPTLRL